MHIRKYVSPKKSTATVFSIRNSVFESGIIENFVSINIKICCYIERSRLTESNLTHTSERVSVGGISNLKACFTQIALTVIGMHLCVPIKRAYYLPSAVAECFQPQRVLLVTFVTHDKSNCRHSISQYSLYTKQNQRHRESQYRCLKA